MFRWVHILPVITFLWFPLTFVLTYVISIILQDVNPVFPYISDTGTYSPTSCIFGQLLNTGAILLGFTLYIRYKQIHVITVRIDSSKFVVRLNTVCLWLGLIASFGISVVANFQETNLFVMHLIGAAMSFGLGGLYLVLQTYISIRIYPGLGHKAVNYIRAVISVICVLFSTATFIFGVISFFQFKGNEIPKWAEKDGGYEYHLVSAASEWITAIFTMVYVLTLSGDFKKITLHQPLVEVKDISVKENGSTERF